MVRMNVSLQRSCILPWGRVVCATLGWDRTWCLQVHLVVSLLGSARWTGPNRETWLSHTQPTDNRQQKHEYTKVTYTTYRQQATETWIYQGHIHNLQATGNRNINIPRSHTQPTDNRQTETSIYQGIRILPLCDQDIELHKQL